MSSTKSVKLDAQAPTAISNDNVFSNTDFDTAITSAVGVASAPTTPPKPAVSPADITRADTLIEKQVALQKAQHLPPEKVWVEIVLPEGYPADVYVREFGKVLVGIRRASALKNIKVRRRNGKDLPANAMQLRFTADQVQ